MNKALVIAPHPDDEVLGVGGTIASLANAGWEVSVLIATRGEPPLFSEESVASTRREAAEAHRILGVKETFHLTLPAARLDTIPHGEVNAQVGEVVRKVQPKLLFIPFNGDIHLDHQQLFLSGLVASRPNGGFVPDAIYAYETLSETNWNAPYLTPGFHPNAFFEITETLETKLQAMQCFSSQVKEFPNERSVTTLRALATLRGSTVHLHAAEAFVLVRQITRF